MKNNVQKRKSLTFGALSAFAAWIYSMAKGGLFGKIFTSYTKMNEMFKKSLCVKLLGNGSSAASAIRSFRFRVAELFEQSALLYLWRKIALFLIGCRVRLYGSFMAVFGIYTGLVYLIKRFAFSANQADVSYLVCAISLIVISVPLIIAKKTVAETLLQSRAGYFIVTEFMGIPQEKLEVPPAKHGDSYNIAIVFGLIAGSLTYFIDPVQAILLIVVLLTVALVLSYPEIGVLITALILPFCSMIGEPTLISCVSLYSFGYIIKLIRGKRIIKINIYDFAMLAFGAVMLLGGLFGAAGELSASTAVLLSALTLGGFIALNLIRTAEWLRRCGFTVFISAFAVSLLILLQYIAQKISALGYGFDISVLGSETLTFFGGANDTAAYLLMAFAITLATVNMTEDKRVRFIMRVGLLMIPAAILAIGSKSGLFGIVMCFLLYCIVTKKKTFGVVVAGAAGLAYAFFMIPRDMLRGVMSYFDTFVLSFWRTVSVWQGAFGAALAASLIGAGAGSFETVYPRLAFAGSETAAEASSLMISLLCEFGIIGVIVFFVAMLLFAQNCFEYMKHSTDKVSSLMAASGLCAVFGVLCQGLFYDIWRDSGIFYMFWFVCAFTVACIRIGRGEAQRASMNMTSSETFASVDLPQ